MNNTRRKRLASILADIEDVLPPAIDAAKQALNEVRDEEADAYGNLPEAFQDGERGCIVQEAISALDDAISLLEDAAVQVDDLRDLIDTASQ